MPAAKKKVKKIELATEWAQSGAAVSEGAVRALEITPGAKPMLNRPGDGFPMPEFAAKLGEVLATKGFYRRKNDVFTIDLEEKCLQELTTKPRTFIDKMEDHVRVVKMRKSDEGGSWPQLCSINTEQATCVLQMPSFVRSLPNIRTIHHAPMPVVRTDANGVERIELLKPGYDAASEIYTFDTGVVIDETVTPEQAVTMLRDITSTFSLVHGSCAEERGLSFAVLVAAMLSTYGRELSPLSAKRPMFVFMANKQGAGKTTLAELCLYPVYGTVSATSAPGDITEFEKVFDSSLYFGEPYILFDNCKGTLNSPKLENYLTSTFYGFRILQRTEKLSVPNVAPVFLTGNNLELSRDLEQRALKVLLHSDESDLRRHNVDEEKELTSDVMGSPEFRSKICSALWAMIRGWKSAGSPPATLSRQFRYPKWARIFGGIVQHNGLGDILYLRDETNSTALEMLRLLTLLVDIQMRSSDFEVHSMPELFGIMNVNGIFADKFDGEKVDRAFKILMGKLIAEYVNVNYTLTPLTIPGVESVVVPVVPLGELEDNRRAMPKLERKDWLAVSTTHARWRFCRHRDSRGVPSFWVQPVMD